jgi:hypothetical protein
MSLIELEEQSLEAEEHRRPILYPRPILGGQIAPCLLSAAIKSPHGPQYLPVIWEKRSVGAAGRSQRDEYDRNLYQANINGSDTLVRDISSNYLLYRQIASVADRPCKSM